MSRFRILLLTAALALLAPAASATADGTPDDTFGTGGFASVDFSDADSAKDAVAQADGKVVVAGTRDGGQPDFAIARLLPDGKPDPGFGPFGAGRVSLTFGPGASGFRDLPGGVALQRDGKIVVAGSSEPTTAGDFDVAVARLNADGSLDKTFSEDGKVTFGGPGSQGADDVVVQPDGKIALAGRAGDDALLARLNGDGSLDTAFDGDGVNAVSAGATASASTLAVQQDGKLVAAGLATVAGAPSANAVRVAVVRVAADGQVDRDFGPSADGTARFDLGVSAHAEAIAIQPSGRIVLAGVVGNLRSDVLLMGVTPAGRTDTSFGQDGRATADFGGDVDVGRALVITPAGRLLAAGLTATNRVADSVLVQFDADGRPDPGFGDGGRRRLDLGPEDKFSGLAVGGRRAFAVGTDGEAGDASDFTVAALRLDAAPEPEPAPEQPQEPAQQPQPPAAEPVPPPDVAAPALGGLRFRPSAFKRPAGTRVSFRLSEAASVELAVQRRILRRGRPTKRFRTLGRLVRSGKPGLTSFRFRGSVGRRKLAPGSYRISVRATDAAGNRSNAVVKPFRVVR